MKKFLALVLALVMCASLVACSSEEAEESIEDKVKDSVQYNIMVRIKLQYDSNVSDITYNINEISENNFEVTGKVTVKDKYDDVYSGKYDATVKYDPETDECGTKVVIDSLYKVQ